MRLNFFALILLVFLPCLGLTQTNFNTFLKNKVFADISVSSTEGALQFATGYRIEEHFGLGLGWSQLERDKPHFGIVVRGTNMEGDTDKFSLFYTAGWWRTVRSVGDFESGSLFEIGAGIRYRDVALTAGYGRSVEQRWEQYDSGNRVLVDYPISTPQLKFSYLLNSYRGERPFLKKVFPWDKGKAYPNLLFDIALGRTFLQSDGVDLHSIPVEATTFDLSLGRQFNRNAGAAFTFHSAGSASLGARYGMTSFGASFRGEPGLFHYKMTAGAIASFSLVDDSEFPGEKFNRVGGFHPVFHFQGGIRLFRKMLLAGGFQWAPSIKGTYQLYDRSDLTNPILLLEEERKTSLTAWQVLVGFSL